MKKLAIYYDLVSDLGGDGIVRQGGINAPHVEAYDYCLSSMPKGRLLADRRWAYPQWLIMKRRRYIRLA